jgi:hypothetical protein
MAEEKSTSPAAPSALSHWRIKLKFFGIGCLIGAIGGGIGAGKVYLDNRAVIEVTKSRAAELESRQGLFESHAAITAASIELRRDNFGDAKTSINTARARLGGVDADAANVSTDVLTTLQGRLDDINIAANGDTSDAVTAIDDVALALDRVINPI